MKTFRSSPRRVLPLALAFVLVVSVLCPAVYASTSRRQTYSSKPTMVGNPAQYTDISGHWAETSLRTAVINGIMVGTTSTTMEPDATLTRAQMATMLVRAFEPQERASLARFVDVPSNAWYYDTLSRAVAMGMISGDGNNMYPNNPISRQEACALIYRAFRLQNTTLTIQGYADVASVSSWAYNAVSACVAIGALRSTDGSIHPQDAITRAEFASMMYSATQAYDTSYVNTMGTNGVSALISSSSGTYYDLNLSSNLYIADGVGRNSVTLNRGYVNGYIVVRGGGSLHLTNDTVVNKVVVEGNVNNFTLSTDASSHVSEVVINNSATVNLEGNFTTVTAKSGSTPVYITDSFVQNLQRDLSITPNVTIDDTSIVENFERNAGYMDRNGRTYEYPAVVEFLGNFDVIDQITVTGYNPIKLYDTYGEEVSDFVDGLAFDVDRRTHTVYIDGDLYRNTFGNRNQFSGYYVPIRFMVEDALVDFDVYVNGTKMTTQVSYDEDVVRLNVLVPFSSEYRTASVEFRPVNSNRFDSVTVTLALENTARFR